ncbi:MAG TPA: endonuclease/exonuclease/phosphatase family protein [Bacteroidia bacterium]|nr:endonuclease/exonuclease/phosphatase family protein [Bacteroidia bacterium]
MSSLPNSASPLKKKKNKRYFFNRIAFFCNHFAAIGLLLSYLAQYVSPERFWLLAFFGLAYPLLIILNIFFVVYWALQFQKRVFYSLLVILTGWGQLICFFQVSFSKCEGPQKLIKVMSYNVKVFDLYNWTHNKETRDKIFNLIDSEGPDIMCLQEFFTQDSSKKYNNLDSLLAFQKAKQVHTAYTTTVKRLHRWGIATFSRYPIVSKGNVDFGYKSNNICIYTDVKVGKDTIRIYNMHLQSIAFGADDYQYMDDLEKNKQTEDIQHSKSIGKRLKAAFLKRSRQADLIHTSIAASPYPVIVCGDFNDTPASYTYHTIRHNMKDAFVEAGNGFGKTYFGKFPSFRIDYILHSNQFKAIDFRTIQEELSDHYPVVTYLQQ